MSRKKETITKRRIGPVRCNRCLAPKKSHRRIDVLGGGGLKCPLEKVETFVGGATVLVRADLAPARRAFYGTAVA